MQKKLSFSSGIFCSLPLSDKQKKHYFVEQQTGALFIVYFTGS